jgi:hypothetical protein
MRRYNDAPCVYNDGVGGDAFFVGSPILIIEDGPDTEPCRAQVPGEWHIDVPRGTACYVCLIPCVLTRKTNVSNTSLPARSSWASSRSVTEKATRAASQWTPAGQLPQQPAGVPSWRTTTRTSKTSALSTDLPGWCLCRVGN